MMKRNFWIALAVAAGAVTFLLAAKFWETKPYTEWTSEEALEILSRSPWVKTESIRLPADRGFDASEPSPFPSPGGVPEEEGGLPPQPGRPLEPAMSQHPIQVIWASLPVRRAYARLAQLEGHLEPDPPEDIGAVQFLIQGQVLAQLTGPGDEQIQERSHLRKRDGKQIPPSEVRFNPNFAENPVIILTFPAMEGEKPILTLDDRDVQLVLQIGRHRLSPRFRLRDLVVGGELAI